jgi:hypothetical protein
LVIYGNYAAKINHPNWQYMERMAVHGKKSGPFHQNWCDPTNLDPLTFTQCSKDLIIGKTIVSLTMSSL